MESTFMNGLLPDIQAELRFLQPYGLGHLMEMAQRVEDRNLAMRAASEHDPNSTKMLSSANQGDWKIGENFQTRAVAVSEKTMSQRREIPIKRLTESKLQARREKGYVLSVMKSSHLVIAVRKNYGFYWCTKMRRKRIISLTAEQPKNLHSSS